MMRSAFVVGHEPQEEPVHPTTLRPAMIPGHSQDEQDERRQRGVPHVVSPRGLALEITALEGCEGFS